MLIAMKIKEISSHKNPTFRKFVKLLAGQGIKRYGMTFLSGPKQVEEVLKDFPDQCLGLLVTDKQDLPDGMDPQRVSVYRLERALFREIDIYGTHEPILLVRAGPLSIWENDQWPQGCTLFLPFQDPSNVGAVIRSAAAFGASRVVMLSEAAHAFHHKSMRVAGSALFRIPILDGPSIKALGETSVPMITLSPKGEDIAGYHFPKAFGLLPGLEGPGLPKNLTNMNSLAIPMQPGVDSINAALATGIALYLWRNQMKGNNGISE